MAKSMTGFGKGSGTLDGQEITVEISAVNHRYLDTSVRTPSALSALEPDIKQCLRDHVSRGKLFVNVNRKRQVGNAGQAVRFDASTAQEYIRASQELAQMLDNPEPLSLNVLAQLEGVFICEDPAEDMDALRETVLAALRECIANLDAMRVSEGTALTEDIHRRLSEVRDRLGAIEQRLPELNAYYEARLRTRIQDLKMDLSITEERIAMEVALLAEKADVTEEVVRLKTHLDHMDEMLTSDGPIGRRLDFLIQELQREINTLGVKTRDSDVSKDVLFMKAELEKIREQTQNLE